jgi:UDP-N-acetylmuramoyl-tripeptide--D-alanyl-D-alanine ligase
MEPQRIDTIAGWIKGRLERGAPGSVAAGVAIDSRTIRPGEIFLALAGERYDGHDYAAAALDSGASGVILSQKVGEIDRRREEFALIRVRDSREALAGLARGYRRLFDLAAIAVTGSNGKTTTKNLIGLFLGRERATLTAPASYNNLIGISLTILRLSAEHRVAVFELGTNRPGEIRQLARLCRPSVAVITNIGPAHIGRFGSLERIAAEKAEVIRELEGEKTVFLNTDDPRAAALAARHSGETFGFGFSPPARIRALDVQPVPGGVSFRATLPSGELSIEAPLPGRHNILNLLAALAVGDHFGIDPGAMRQAALRAVLPPGRMEIIPLGGAEIINDAYNANPASMAAALETWLGMECSGRRILVSGDMNELGDFSQTAHREWGERLARLGIDCLIFLGPLSRMAAAAVRTAGGRSRLETVDSCRAAAAILQEVVRPGDSVLLKGSRKMGMEEIVEILRSQETESRIQEPECRRGRLGSGNSDF